MNTPANHLLVDGHLLENKLPSGEVVPAHLSAPGMTIEAEARLHIRSKTDRRPGTKPMTLQIARGVPAATIALVAVRLRHSVRVILRSPIRLLLPVESLQSEGVELWTRLSWAKPLQRTKMVLSPLQ